MKTIEDRAREYALASSPEVFDQIARAAGYSIGAKAEHELLTKWHNPKEELPDDDVEVLVMVHRPFQTYAILRHDEYGWWQPVPPRPMLDNDGWVCIDDEEVFAWREIHEKL